MKIISLICQQEAKMCLKILLPWGSHNFHTLSTFHSSTVHESKVCRDQVDSYWTGQNKATRIQFNNLHTVTMMQILLRITLPLTVSQNLLSKLSVILLINSFHRNGTINFCTDIQYSIYILSDIIMGPNLHWGWILHWKLQSHTKWHLFFQPD